MILVFQTIFLVPSTWHLNQHQWKYTNWNSHVMILWVLLLLKYKQKDRIWQNAVRKVSSAGCFNHKFTTNTFVLFVSVCCETFAPYSNSWLFMFTLLKWSPCEFNLNSESSSSTDDPSSFKQFNSLNNTSDVHVRTLIHHLCALYLWTFGFSNHHHHHYHHLQFNLLRLYLYDEDSRPPLYINPMQLAASRCYSIVTVQRSQQRLYVCLICLHVLIVAKRENVSIVEYIEMTPPTVHFILARVEKIRFTARLRRCYIESTNSLFWTLFVCRGYYAEHRKIINNNSSSIVSSFHVIFIYFFHFGATNQRIVVQLIFNVALCVI